jgi:hypothetical protein
MLIVYFFKHERKGFQNEIVIIIKKKDEPVIFQHLNGFLERGENSGKACYI